MNTYQSRYNRSLLPLLFTIALSVFSLSAQSNSIPTNEIKDQQWKSFNIDTVNNYIVPAYSDLNTHAKSLNKSIEELCQSPINSKAKRDLAQEQFHLTMDAWQYIQNIQFGPIEILMRNYSLQFWPDKKNHVSKHLSILLNSKDHQDLSDEAFHKASVSIKGLPAIERFLFEEDLNKALSKKPFHCKVVIRISDYIAETTDSLVNEWQDMKTEFSSTDQLDGYFEDDIDAATTLLKALVEPIETIRDLKLLRPLGSEFGQQKSKRLESWRTNRSLRNIEININSLYDFYHGTQVDNHTKSSNLSSLLNQQDDEKIRMQFQKILKLVSAIPSPIEDSIDTQQGYNTLRDLSDTLKTLHNLLENAVNNQGIHLGFNSRDGD